jgi:hypothetical protein
MKHVPDIFCVKMIYNPLRKQTCMSSFRTATVKLNMIPQDSPDCQLETITKNKQAMWGHKSMYFMEQQNAPVSNFKMHPTQKPTGHQYFLPT